jgi:hypothetical protein
MTSPLQAQRVYQELADWYERQAQAQLRDRFLLLAADAALAAGQPDEAEHLRQRLLERSPHHMVKPFASFAEALRSPDVQGYLYDLRQSYPQETAEQLLQSLHGGEAANPPPAPAPNSAPPPAVAPTAEQPAAQPWPPREPELPAPPPQPRAREPLRVFRAQEEEPPPPAPPSPPQRPAAPRRAPAAAAPAPEPAPPRPRPAPPAPQPKAAAPPIPLAQPEPVARPAPPPPVAVPVRRPAPPVASALPLREAAPPPPPRAEPVKVEQRPPAPPRLPSRPVPPPPAPTAERRLPREPTGSWVSGSLFVLVLLAGTALAAYTLGRPFLPPEWLP